MRRLLAALIVLGLAAPAAAQYRVPNRTPNPAIVSDNQARIFETDTRAQAAAVAGNGVLDPAFDHAGCLVSPTAPASLGVVVVGCDVQLLGVTIAVTGDTLAITASSGIVPRFDLVVANDDGTVSIEEGTGAATPDQPSYDADTQVLLAVVYRPAASTSVLATHIVDKRFFVPSAAAAGGSGIAYELNPLDFGAVCDGATDDAAAIQATIDALAQLTGGTGGGWVRWPEATCAVATTINLGDTSGDENTTFIGIRGAGPAKSRLLWIGATDGTALQMTRNKYARIEGFGIGNAVAKGTTIGFLQTGYGGIGTETLGNVFDHFSVSGFNICLQVGDPSNGGTAASDSVYIRNEYDSCGTGWVNYELNTLNHTFLNLNLTSNSTVGLNARIGNVQVVGGSTNGNAIDYLTSADMLEIDGVRPEVSSGHTFLKLAGSGFTTTIRNIYMAGTPATDVKAVDVTSSNGTLTIADSVLTGIIDVPGNARSITIDSVYLYGGATLPFYNAPAASGPNFMRVTMRNVVNYTAIGVMATYADRQFEYANEQPQLIMTTRPHTSSADVLPSLQLNRLTMISQGSTANGRNIGGSFTFAASTSFSFLFKRSITAYDSGGLGSPAHGKRFHVSSGKIYKSDLGKLVTITIGGSPVSAYIFNVDEGAQTFDWDGTAGGCGTCDASPLTTVIGEDEPDANYFVDGFACEGTTPLYLAFSSLATTGLTITSNTSSSVTCHFSVRR